MPRALLLSVFMVAASTWVGGYVAIAVVARAAAATLDPTSRVAFFRSLGRSYLSVGVSALVVALATGAVLARGHSWDALLVSTVAVAAALVVCLGVAVVQARQMTRLRSLDLKGTDESMLAAVRRGSQAATALRMTLGLLTLALVVLGSFLAT